MSWQQREESSYREPEREVPSDTLGRFPSLLERRAGEIALGRLETGWEAAPMPMVEREIALVLGQILGLRATHRAHLKHLLDAECYTETELLQMEDRTPIYSPDRYPERQQFQRTLLAIGQERMRALMAQQERLQPLHRRLLELLEQHRQMGAFL